MNRTDFFKKFTEVNGISGHEQTVRKMMREELEPYVDEFLYDRIGSIIGKKSGNSAGPKVMLAGHMDEVGFIVTKIEDDGFIRVQPIGGWWSQVVLAHQVVITTEDENTYHGIIGARPPHLMTPEDRKKVVDMKDIYIDIGVKDKAKAEELGIKMGDPVTPYMEFRELADPKYMLAKAWDDRVGCLIAMDVAKELKNRKHPNECYFVGTVQEEVGCRGAITASNLINPDIAIALDVTIADDTPGEKKLSIMGDGPSILVYDGGLIGHRFLRRLIVETADEKGIPYQLGYMDRGATDSSQMHIAHDGAPSISFCIPSRYIHSHGSIIHRDDYENCVKLLVEIIMKLDKERVHQITYGDK